VRVTGRRVRGSPLAEVSSRLNRLRRRRSRTRHYDSRMEPRMSIRLSSTLTRPDRRDLVYPRQDSNRRPPRHFRSLQPSTNYVFARRDGRSKSTYPSRTQSHLEPQQDDAQHGRTGRPGRTMGGQVGCAKVEGQEGRSVDVAGFHYRDVSQRRDRLEVVAPVEVGGPLRVGGRGRGGHHPAAW
jgi:hypothetical protein